MPTASMLQTEFDGDMEPETNVADAVFSYVCCHISLFKFDLMSIGSYSTVQILRILAREF